MPMQDRNWFRNRHWQRDTVWSRETRRLRRRARWLRLKRRLGPGFTALALLALGAAISVLVVYPLLPHGAQSWVSEVQSQIANGF